jgi:hypothetical protein
MANLDPEKEHQRLADLYASMSDEELQQIAADAWSLSGPGHDALQDEVTKRKSSIALNETPPSIEVPEKRDLVLVRRYRDLPEALFAKSTLDSAGIECFLVDENIVRMDWFWSTLMGGIKLMVDPGNVDEAAAILGQPIPETLAVEGVGEYRQPHCPACQSLDVSFEELRKGVAFTTAYFLSLPLPLHRADWLCHACGHHWQAPADDGESVA